MNKLVKNYFGALSNFNLNGKEIKYYRLNKLEDDGIAEVSQLPFSIKVLLESILRECNEIEITRDDVVNLAQWVSSSTKQIEIPFKPARVILQDFTGVPSVVDLAALRSTIARLGGDPNMINPIVPVNLVIDHSVQVDSFGSKASLFYNAEREFERNRERYEFLRWGQQAFDNFDVVPPSSGIVHQVNLEHIAKVVQVKKNNGDTIAYPDSLVGTDSHTTMINGLGIVGWGVGGIEAEAIMLGQPIYMLMPEVVGFKLVGKLQEGVTATDMTLTITQVLRNKGVVGKFVEYYGPGLGGMTLQDRATIANMAPEYGATMGYFPVDDESLRYLLNTGRSKELIQLVEKYTKEQGLFRTEAMTEPIFSDKIELDLSTIQPTMAGPKRPQDRVLLSEMKNSFGRSLTAPVGLQGFGLSDDDLGNKSVIDGSDTGVELKHGAVVISAITSCTNTSNPSVMIGAGIVAKKAVEKGLKVPEYVKTSLAPGSKVVTKYLTKSGLLEYLEELGFNLVGYGCTTCIGNSGPLSKNIVDAITSGSLIVAGVLSGNRNFEGRIHPYVKANYLASPPLVVAYALAGTVNIDLVTEPIGIDKDGNKVFLKDLWPSSDEIAAEMDHAIDPIIFKNEYDGIEESNEEWNNISVRGGGLFEWDPESTYIQEPPFFKDLTSEIQPIQPIVNARVLVKVGDSITTDHISPAGAIPDDMPAGKYLIEKGIPKEMFNSFGSRRGNDQVMTRGTFGNIRLKNQLAPGTEGGWTTYFPTDEIMSIYEAAEKYHNRKTPLIVIAGKEYGTGSSRDWAAKGTLLLGVKAVITKSYERIHRSNLVGMGVLPLQFKNGESPEELNLKGDEVFTIHIDDDLKPGQTINIDYTTNTGIKKSFQVVCRIDTPVEINYFRNGGILHTVLRNLLTEQ